MITARLGVHVVPPAGQPSDAPDGWRNAAAIVYVAAHRPRGLGDEDDRVVPDAYRAARDILNRHWSGFSPSNTATQPLHWHLLAGLRGR
ncbi:hypothetical protein ACIOHB_31765 [Streptomyces microflavus]|uniref:hypothetical protein n=1 Tax=Streptomyces microflavus TaxID=1919 RepID=UPI0033BD76BF